MRNLTQQIKITKKEAHRTELLDTLAAIRKEHNQLPNDLTDIQKAIHLLRLVHARGITKRDDMHAAAQLIGNITRAGPSQGELSPIMKELLRITPPEDSTDLQSETAKIRRAIFKEHPMTTKRKTELAKKLGIGIGKINDHIKSMQYEKIIE